MDNIRAVTREIKIQQWKGIFQAKQNSSLSVDEFCKENGISHHAYYYWLRIVRENIIEGISSGDEHQIVEVPQTATIRPDHLTSVPPSKTVREESCCLIIEKNGFHVTVTEDTSAAVLAKVLGAIKYA